VKNRIETDKENKTVKKIFRSRIAWNKEKELLNIMYETDMVPQITGCDNNILEMEYCEGILISDILSGHDANSIIHVSELLVQWLENFQTVFHEETGAYIVLEDINPRNFIYNPDIDSITGIDFEAWHTGEKNENIISFIALIKTAHFSNEDIKDKVYRHILSYAKCLSDISCISVESKIESSVQSVINRRNAMQFIRNCDSVVIAGGKSSRMGSDKGLLAFNGYTFTDHILYSLQIFDSVAISANSAVYSDFGCKVIGDKHYEKGPMAALYAGLEASEKEWVFFIPCDMPFITTETILYMASVADKNRDCIIAQCGGRIFPTVGFYSKKLMPQILHQLENDNLKLMKLLENADTQYIVIDKVDEFVNINTKQDYEKIKGEV